MLLWNVLMAEMESAPFPIWVPQDLVVGTSWLGSEWRSVCLFLEAFLLAVPAVVSGALKIRNCCNVNVTDLVVFGFSGTWTNFTKTPRITFLVILYDDMFRRLLSKRPLLEEPGFDGAGCFSKMDKQLNAPAEQKLDGILVATGVSRQTLVLHGGAMSQDISESPLAEQAAAGDAVQKRTEAATSNLAKQQEDMNRSQTMQQSWVQEQQ